MLSLSQLPSRLRAARRRGKKPSSTKRASATVEPLESRQLLTTYYLSPAGSDANPGTRRAPWQSLERVSKQAFQGGDRILFEGGQSFNGTLYLGPDDKGSRTAPIAVSSYGIGRARINGVQGNGLFAYNTTPR